MVYKQTDLLFMQEILLSPVEGGSWNPIIYKVLYIPGGSQDFWSINSRAGRDLHSQIPRITGYKLQDFSSRKLLENPYNLSIIPSISKRKSNSNRPINSIGGILLQDFCFFWGEMSWLYVCIFKISLGWHEMIAPIPGETHNFFGTLRGKMRWRWCSWAWASPWITMTMSWQLWRQYPQSCKKLNRLDFKKM